MDQKGTSDIGRTVRKRATKFTELQEEEFRDLFGLFDVDEDNCVTMDELVEVLDIVGINVPDAKLKEVFASYDTNGTGKLEFPEFSAFMEERYFHELPKEEYVSAFTSIVDQEKKGITLETLNKVWAAMGSQAMPEDITELFNKFDKEGTGVISVSDFVDSMVSYGMSDTFFF